MTSVTFEDIWPPMFVYHAGAWHHTTMTYCGGGADSACGLARVSGLIIAFAFPEHQDVKTQIAAFCNAQGGLSEESRAPLCAKCFSADTIARDREAGGKS